MRGGEWNKGGRDVVMVEEDQSVLHTNEHNMGAKQMGTFIWLDEH